MWYDALVGGGLMLARDLGIIHLPAVVYLCWRNVLLSRFENAPAEVEVDEIPQ
jgi:hypothetical protein